MSSSQTIEKLSKDAQCSFTTSWVKNTKNVGKGNMRSRVVWADFSKDNDFVPNVKVKPLRPTTQNNHNFDQIHQF